MVIDDGLEKMKAKGLPDMKDLMGKVKVLVGRARLCGNCPGAKDTDQTDLMGGIEGLGATGVMSEISDPTVTFFFG